MRGDLFGFGAQDVEEVDMMCFVDSLSICGKLRVGTAIVNITKQGEK